MDTLGPLFRRHIRLLLQQIEVADHRGEGRPNIVGQIHHQLVLPLFRQGCFRFSLRQRPLYRVQLPLEGQHFRRQLDLFFVVCQQRLNALVDLAEIACHPSENPHQQYRKYQQDSGGKKYLFVTPKMVAVIIKRIFVFHFEKCFQQPDNPIAHSLFPNKQIKPYHHSGGGNCVDAGPPDQFGLKRKVFVLSISFQFYTLPPISF